MRVQLELTEPHPATDGSSALGQPHKLEAMSYVGALLTPQSRWDIRVTVARDSVESTVTWAAHADRAQEPSPDALDFAKSRDVLQAQHLALNDDNPQPGMRVYSGEPYGMITRRMR